MRIFLIFLLLPLKLFSQDIEGVWTGTIYNDTTHKYIPYEIAIIENKGKLSGFSHTIFIGENNRQETGVKSLKIKKKSDKILIEDNELIYNNYAEPAPKGVKQYSVLNVMPGDSGLLLIGVFNTNRTKEYASLTGTIRLQKKNKISETKLIPKLNELNLASSLSFIQTKAKEKDEAAIVPANTKVIQSSSQPKQQEKEVAVIFLPKTQKESSSPGNEDTETEPLLIAIKEDTIDYKIDVFKAKDVASVEKQKTEAVKNPTVSIKKSEPLLQLKKQIVSTPTIIKKQPVVQPKKEVAVIPLKEDKKSQPLPQPKEKVTTAFVPKLLNKPIPQSNSKENINPPPPVKKSEVVSVPKEKNKEQIITPISKPIQKSAPVLTPVVSLEELAKRKIETIRTVDFKSDSLVLTLYDNGVIDGDTVSVILNGKTIISKQMLTANALTKTIYITPDLGDSLQLIMYAENLGSIPPNTGLLIIHDGEDMYQIRFAGDLQKNSAIILRRKKN